MVSPGGSIVASLKNVNGFLAVYTPSDDLISTDFKQKGVVPEIVFYILKEFTFLLGQHALNNKIPRMVVCEVSKPWARFSAPFVSITLKMNSWRSRTQRISTSRYVVPTGRVVVPTSRTRRDRDGRVIILPLTTTEEHIIVQRESKERTTLLQSIPDDHVAAFHYMDDARDIWNAIKAGMQKILSQLNQLKAKPEDENINLKCLRALPLSWSQVAITLKTKGGLELLSFNDLYYKLKTLEVDAKGYTTFSSSQSASPSHSAFVSATSASKKMSYGDSLSYSSTTTYSVPSNSKTGSHKSDFEQIEKLDLEEMDLKWKMAMLYVRVHKFEQKAGKKIDFDKKESARFNKKKVRCYKCQQRGHFARECRVKGGNDKQRYFSFKIKEIGKKEEDTKALITIDTLVNWTDHDSKSDGVIASKEFVMIDGCDTEDVIKEGAAKIYNLITGADTKEASTAGDAGEFALMGVTSKVHYCPFGCDNKYNELHKQYNELNEQNDHDSKSDGVIASKEFDMIAGCDTEDAIKEGAAKIYNLITGADTKEASTAGDAGEFALMGVTSEVHYYPFCCDNKYNELHKQYNELNEQNGRPLFHRFAKAVPPPLSGDYTSLSDHIDVDESQMSYGTKSSTSCDSKSVSNDFISCDDSNKSLEVNTNDLPPVILVTGKVNIPPARPQPVPTGKPNRPFPVPTDRGYYPSVISGWWKSIARPMPHFSRRTSSYFQTYTPYVPIIYYNHMKYGKDRWATAVKPSAGYSWRSHRKDFHWENLFLAAEDEGVFDSGCYRSIINKLFEDQSLLVLRPSRLCAQAQLGDDMLFHKQAYMEYTQLVFTDNESDDASVHNEATSTQQQPNIQPQILTTVSNNNAKFPYLKKDEYEVWAMKMEYWITNNDMNIWKVIQIGNIMKRTRKDRDGRVIILPLTTTKEYIVVQRESKARTTLLQSIPDDHVADFHYMDDARDIWNAFKARFGGNAKSKKMRKSMLKQEFSKFRIGKAEGLHKGYEMMQKIMSQLNQLKAKPKDEDINLKFLRALPSSWPQTLEVDAKGYTTFSSSQSARPSHSAFVSATSASKKMSYGDSLSYSSTTTYSIPSNSKTGSHKSGNVIEDVLQSFVVDTEPEQQLAYVDFKQVEKLDLEDMDLKWKMAMLSVRVHKFEQKAGRKIDFDKKESARFNKKKVRCYKYWKEGRRSKALTTVDTLVDWTDHDSESDGVIASKEFGMIAGCDTEDAIKESAAKIYNLITRADTKEASTAGDAGEFALMGVTSEVHYYPFGCDNKYNELHKQYNELNEQNDHDSKSDEVIASKEFGMIAGCDTEDTIKECAAKIYNLITRADTKEASTAGDAGEFALMGVTFETDHDSKSDGVIASKEFGMIAGCDTEDAIKEGAAKIYNSITGADTKEASTAGDAGEFALVGVTSEVHYCPFGYENKYNELHKQYNELNEQNDHDSESDGVIASKEFGMIAGCDTEDAINEGAAKIYNLITGADIKEASTAGDAGEFAFMSVTSEVHYCPFGCDNKTGKVNIPPARPQPVPTGRPNRPFLVPADRGYSPSENPFSAVEDERVFDSGCYRSMTDTECLVLSKDFKLPDDSMVVLKVPRKHNLYTINLNNLYPKGNLACLLAHASFDKSVKWHRRMGHVNYKNMNGLVKGNLVRGLPPKPFKNDHTCVACCKGKQHKASYKAINAVSFISEPLKLLHMNLFGPTSIRSIDHKYYCLVITDDYSRFCWVFFLEHKDETYHILKNFINLVENQLNKKREYSNARTPHQNRVAERKNRTLIETARTILADSKLPTMFWTEAVRTACYVLNKVSVTSPHNKTPYALLIGSIPYVSHFKPFGCHVTILNTSDHLGKFDGKADEGYIVGYSISNKAYRVYNVPNKRVEETMNLRFLEEKPNVQGLGHEWYFDLDYLTDTLGTQDADSDSDCDEQVIIVPSYLSHSILRSEPKDTSGNEVDDSPLHSANKIFQKELARLKGQAQQATSDAESLGLGIPVPTSNIPVPAGVTMVSTNDVPVHTRSSTDSFFDDEPTTRFPCPSDLGNHDPSPGIFSSSSYDDAFGTALNNVASTMEARLVAQGHRQEEGIDYDEVFALVARIEVYKVVKALYGLHQAPRAWYATLSTFLLKHGYRRGIINKTLFLKKNNRDIILVQVYVDDIIFGSTKKAWCDEFEALMKREFQMSAMGELTFFLGLQVQQRPNGIFVNQDKYVQEILNKFDLASVKMETTPYEAPKPKSKNEYDIDVNVHLYRSMIGSLMYLTASRPDIMFAVSACSRNQVTPITLNLEAVKKIFMYLKGQPKLGLWYPKESPLVLEAYSDNDYAGANNDRKSTTGGCQFMGRRFISWQCKKQTIVAISSTEAEYVAAANCYGQPNGSRRWISAFQVLYMDQVALDLVRSRIQLADDGGIADLPIAEIYSGMDNLGTKSGSWEQFGSPIVVALICLSDGRRFNWSSYILRGWIKRQYKVLMFSRKLFANMTLNFEGHPMPILPTMFLQAQAGEGVETPAGPFTNVEDEPLGGSFHMSPPWSTQAPSAGQPSGDAEDPITLTALSSVVSTLVQKVNFLETKLKDHKKLFKDVVGKLVKKVKAMEVKLKTKKRKMVGSDSDQEEGENQDMDLDALHLLANAAVTVDSNISPSGASNNLAASIHVPTAVPTGATVVPAGASTISPGASTVPTGASTIPVVSLSVPADVSPSVAPDGVSKKGKSLMVEEDIPIKARTFKQMQEDILGEQAAKRLHDEEQAQMDRERAELQRRRQEEVLDSDMYYTMADWLNIMAQVEANASLSKTLLGDDVYEDNFPAIMAALIKRKKQALAEKLAKERQNKPLTQAQQRAYMRQTLKRTGPVLEEPSFKRQKSTKAPIPSVPEVPHSLAVSLPPSSRTGKKSLVYQTFYHSMADSSFGGQTGSSKIGDLQVLFDSHKGVSGEMLYMFADVSYPLSVKLMERMLTHNLEIDIDVVGNDMTTAEQLIQFIKNQLVAALVSSV
nr:putative ribonuclease H-like domain-containing protein [Tanacetum cinerariifolium]